MRCGAMRCDAIGGVEVADRIPVTWTILLRQHAGEVEVQRRRPLPAAQRINADRSGCCVLVRLSTLAELYTDRYAPRCDVGRPEMLPHPIALSHPVGHVRRFVQVCMRIIGAMLSRRGTGLLKVHHADDLGG